VSAKTNFMAIVVKKIAGQRTLGAGTAIIAAMAHIFGGVQAIALQSWKQNLQ